MGIVCKSFDESEEGRELESLPTSPTLSDVAKEKSKSPYKASWGAQMNALMWRSWLSVIKEPLIVKVRIAQTIVIALILGIVYFGQEYSLAGVQSINGALFLVITNMTFSNMFAIINVITMEVPIFLREHFNGMYRSDVYFLTKQIAELPVFVVTPLLFLGILYYMVPFNDEFQRFVIAIGITEVLTQTVVSFGYLISCLANSVQMALAFGPTLLIPLMLSGGLFLNNTTIPVYLNWIKYISWFMYSNEALLINQWRGAVIETCTDGPMNQQVCSNITGESIIEETLGFNMDNFEFDIAMLAVLAVGFRVVAYLALLMKTFRKK